MLIPLVDLRAQHATIRGEIDAAMQEVVRDAAFVGGRQIAEFESAFAAFCGAGRAVGVGNGTDALALALRACGVGWGDEVITVPNTFIATAEAIGAAGARPVFVDIDERTYTMSPAHLEAAVTPRTRAVIPVHLYGQMADMERIVRLARGRGLAVVEDACQAHGAEYRGRRAGTVGDAAAFSFYPGKNLGAYGDAGAVLTGDAGLAERIRKLRNHGRTAKYDHDMEGVNSRLDTLQAAVLCVKLRRLEAWNQARRDLAGLYREEIGGIEEIAIPQEAEGRRHVYHLYVIRARRRDELLEHLRRAGIGAGIHYPVPLHLLGAYRELGLRDGAFPVAEAAGREILSLPIYPEMTPEQVHHVGRAIRAFYAGARA